MERTLTQVVHEKLVKFTLAATLVIAVTIWGTISVERQHDACCDVCQPHLVNIVRIIAVMFLVKIRAKCFSVWTVLTAPVWKCKCGVWTAVLSAEPT